MNKKTIITILLTLVALAVQAKTFKTIKNPVIPHVAKRAIFT